MLAFHALIVAASMAGQTPGLDIGREEPIVPVPIYSFGKPMPQAVQVTWSLIGRALSVFLNRGMTNEDVRRILGRRCGFTTVSSGYTSHYYLLRLNICYRQSGEKYVVESATWLGIP